jgi:hypothetical protein
MNNQTPSEKVQIMAIKTSLNNLLTAALAVLALLSAGSIVLATENCAQGEELSQVFEGFERFFMASAQWRSSLCWFPAACWY